MFRNMVAAYQILGENRFKIIAYERAADSIEHLTSEVKDLWDDGQMQDIPGIGKTITEHIDELFRTGHVKHFETTFNKLPKSIYPLLLVPGIGPKKAYAFVQYLHLFQEDTVIEDLKNAAKKGKIAPIEGFGEKSQAEILKNLELYQKGQIKENRIPLSEADAIATNVLAYLKTCKDTVRADTLGSLRRKVSTIGDIDIAVATRSPETVIKYFVSYPHKKIIEEGPTGASLLLSNGRQVDLRVQKPDAYGAMLQYFTGSKNHNIKLREYALGLGLSLSEHGIKIIDRKKYQETGVKRQVLRNKQKNNTTNGVVPFATEDEFYHAIGLDWIPPELREDKGEIEAALRQAQAKPGLPHLVELSDIKGDLHIHTNYDLEPSHDLGADTIEKYLDTARGLGYSYIGISDHNPSIGNHTKRQIVHIMKRRKAYYEQHYYSWIKNVSKNGITHSSLPKIFMMCEVDILPDGTLALPEEAFTYVDGIIASVHTSFGQVRAQMTRRVVHALTYNPKVRIFGHPTTRMLGKREEVEFDWNEIFTVCKQHSIALEINSYPMRLDLPYMLVFEARKNGIKFCINSDAHAVNQMVTLPFGISVSRRGWAQKNDIVNTLEYNEFRKWLEESP